MVWGFVFTWGVVCLLQVNGTVNGPRYISFLNLSPSPNPLENLWNHVKTVAQMRNRQNLDNSQTNRLKNIHQR